MSPRLRYTNLALEGINEPNSYHIRNQQLYNYHITNNIPMDYGPTKYMASAQKLLDHPLDPNAGHYVRACRLGLREEMQVGWCE